jgi:hypothetical protein
MSIPLPTEEREQMAVVQYLELKGHKFTAIPNETGGGVEHYRRATKMKRQGVRKGFPDMVAIINNQFICIEMKRIKGSKISQEQKDWIEAIERASIPVKVCYGSDEAIEFIQQFEKQ